MFFALVLMLPGGAAFAQTDAPIPAPGQELPPHAAGGWPTELTGDNQKPERTPEQQARLAAVANELKRLAKEHGPDSVVLQSKLLIRSMGAGALGATEVRVAGASPEASDHLQIVVDTGLYFDSKTTTAEARRDSVWKDVAAPVLEEMVSFKIEPSSLELIFLYDVQEFFGAADPTTASEREAFRIRMGRELLDDIMLDRIVGDAVRAKVDLQLAPVPPAIAAPAIPAAAPTAP